MKSCRGLYLCLGRDVPSGLTAALLQEPMGFCSLWGIMKPSPPWPRWLLAQRGCRRSENSQHGG